MLYQKSKTLLVQRIVKIRLWNVVELNGFELFFALQIRKTLVRMINSDQRDVMESFRAYKASWKCGQVFQAHMTLFAGLWKLHVLWKHGASLL